VVCSAEPQGLFVLSNITFGINSIMLFWILKQVFHFDSSSPQICYPFKSLRKMQTREKIFQKKGLCWTMFYHVLSKLYFLNS
jgi:hypothetical protein